MTRPLAAIYSIALLCLLCANSATAENGSVIIRLSDGASSRCINPSTDQIWLTMRRVIINKESTLFTKEKYAGIIIHTTINGRTGSQTAKIMFPRMIEADIEKSSDGHGVSIPVEFSLLQGFQLKTRDNSYTNIEFDFKVIKNKERNNWGDALNALVNITKNLPLPSNPFSDGFLFFANYANSLIDTSLQKNKTDSVKEGNITLNFSPSGLCTDNSFESNGTIAVIQSSIGLEEDGFVDISKINNDEYCWAPQLKPTFAIKFGRKSSDGSCKAVTAIRNDYYGFFLNALPTSVDEAQVLREDFRLNDFRWNVSNTKANEIIKDYLNNSNSANIELQANAATALEWDPSARNVPFDDSAALTLNKSTYWRTTPTKSAAFDLAEAIRRCEANGVASEQCLPGRKIVPDNDFIFTHQESGSYSK